MSASTRATPQRIPPASWDLFEGVMPESSLHRDIVEVLRAILLAWATRAGERAPFVASNLAVRWDAARPSVGVDPDVCVISPPPPKTSHGSVTSVRTWLPGHAAPMLAIEVVSESNPQKDSAVAPEKYAACGVQELWVFDPLLAGPRGEEGGPYRLQIWERGSDGSFARTYAGAGPARSNVLSAWLVIRGETELRVADNAAGTSLWLTGQEADRAAKESERAAKETERAAKETERAAKEAALAANEAALARIAELEAELARRA